MRKISTKTQARIDLSGGVGQAFLLFCGQILTAVGAGFASFGVRAAAKAYAMPAVGAAGECALLALSLWIVCALRQGTLAWHMRRINGREPTLLPIYYWLRRARSLRAGMLNAVTAALRILFALPLFFPALTLAAAAWYFGARGAISSACRDVTLIGAAVSGAASVLFACVLSQRYAMAPFLLAKDPRCSLRDALRLSRVCMDGRCFAVFCFKLSFLPWFLSCVTILPIVYTVPYYRQSLVCRMEEIFAVSASSCAQSMPARRPAPRRPQPPERSPAREPEPPRRSR